jgi:hypothetical protein
VFINATDCKIRKLMGVPEVFDIGLGYAAYKLAASAQKTSCPVLVAISQDEDEDGEEPYPNGVYEDENGETWTYDVHIDECDDFPHCEDTVVHWQEQGGSRIRMPDRTLGGWLLPEAQKKKKWMSSFFFCSLSTNDVGISIIYYIGL